jgi:hypothetical protein
VKDENKKEIPLEDTKNIQYDDSSISWPDQVLETGNVFELDLESNGIRGETDHSKKSSTFKDTKKSRPFKSAAHAGMDGETVPN